MALLGGRRFRRRKKEVIFVEGYQIDHANDAVPGLDRADETFHIFGVDSPETDVQHNYGSLQLSVLDKETNNAILDLLCEYDPSDTAPRQYKVEDLTSIDVWANVKNSDNTRYIKSWMITGWTPGMPLPSGAPNDKAAYSVTGNGDLPRQFQGAWIQAKKLTSGAAMTLGVTPLQVPRETGVYALRIKAIRDSGGVFEQTSVPVSAAMVGNAGNVYPQPINALVTGLSGAPTHYYILFLQSGTGVYPTVLPDKFRT